jgi:hypothetical protein
MKSIKDCDSEDLNNGKEKSISFGEAESSNVEQILTTLPGCVRPQNVLQKYCTVITFFCLELPISASLVELQKGVDKLSES